MLSIFPRERRATALAIWSITTLVAPICGPILGGYISDSWHWGWIFLINVPVGLMVVALVWAYLGDAGHRHAQAAHRCDRPGPVGGVGGRAAGHAGHRQE